LYCGVDLLEVIENTKRSNSPEVSSTLPGDLAEMMKNPMDSTGVEQLLARVVSSTSTVNKGISPPLIRSYTPSATIEEITGMYAYILYIYMFYWCMFCKKMV